MGLFIVVLVLALVVIPRPSARLARSLVARKRYLEGQRLLATWRPTGDLKDNVEAEMEEWKRLHEENKFSWQKPLTSGD